MKKVVMTTATVAMLISTTSFTTTLASTTSNFTDVPSTDVNYQYINDLSVKGKVKGEGNGNFAPNQTLTRAEAVTMIENAFGVPSYGGSIPFKDVKSTDWFFQHIKDAYGSRVTAGTSATTFSPNDTLTREEAATMVWNYASNNGLIAADQNATNMVASDADTWAKIAVQNIMSYGFRSDNGSKYNSKNPMTRGNMAALIDLAMNHINGTKITPVPTPTTVNKGLGYGNPTSNPTNLTKNSDGSYSLGNITAFDGWPTDTVKTSLNLMEQVKITTTDSSVTISLPSTGTNNTHWVVGATTHDNYEFSDAKTVTFTFPDPTNPKNAVDAGLVDYGSTGDGYADVLIYKVNGQWTAKYR